MAQHEMTHPIYGPRVVEDWQVEGYLDVGWSQAAEVVPETVDASMTSVLEHVGQDPLKAREALTAEQSRTSPRQKLVASLVRVIESDNKES